MRQKLLAAWMACMLFMPLILCAQQKQVSGTVTNTRGEPVPAATIQEKGTSNTVVADNAGRFTLTVGANAVLLISSVNMEAQEVRVGTSTTISATLQESRAALSEVVVTAFGVRRQKKSLGFATQEVSGQDLTRENPTSFVTGLQGKVAGVNINQSGGTPGAGASIIIRGIKSLDPSSNNQPLIILDGLPINNSTAVGNVLPSAGSNSASSSEQFSFTNRAFDINPEDIESISVLKGAGATALYGLEGANGVIIITTKKGIAGRLSISVNSSISMDKVTKYPEIQTRYREGFNGRLRLNANGTPNRFQTFGPPTTDEPIYYNFRDFWETGIKYMNTVSLSQGNERFTFYASASATNHSGIVSGSGLDRYTFRINPTLKVNEKLTIQAAATLMTSESIKPSSGDKGVMSALSFYSPTFDVNDYINPDGSMKVFSPGVIDNPKYVGKFSTLNEQLFRTIGNIGLTYEFAKWLKLDYKVGGDYYSDNHVRIVPGPRFPGDPATLDLAAGQGGYITNERIAFRDVNSNLFLTANKTFNKDWEGSVMLGNAIQSTRTDYIMTRGEKFALPFFYDISNTSNLFSNASLTKRNLIGAFADVKFSFRNALFFNVTGRNDWSSTLPSNNRSFFYPSASVSYVFTDLHNLSGNLLSYGKLRLSAAQVGKDAPPYRNGPYFNATPGFPFGSVPGFVLDRDINDPNLKPEQTNSYEAGLEFRLLNNRIGFDATYYVQNSNDQIIRVPISSPSGYDFYTTNAGEIQNKGLELTMNGSIIKGRNLRWDATLNWSTNESEVKSIREGINEIIFFDRERIVNKLVPGGSAGDLYGRKFRRSADGQLLINAQGLPEINQTFEVAGNAFPDWTGSVLNNISFKGITLSTLLEYRQGGDVYDLSMRNAIRNGILKTTENRYQQITFKGVNASGAKNTVPVFLDDAFYRSENNYNGAAEVLLQDASWLRLRNVSLSYDLNKSLLTRTRYIKGARIALSANNFILWTPFKGFDPETTAFGAGSNSFGYMGLNIPGTSNYSLAVNLNF